MTSFRYQIAHGAGGVSEGVIEAPDRRSALQALAGRGVFPSVLEPCAASGPGGKSSVPNTTAKSSSPVAVSRGIRRREITAFSRELAALVDAGIPIPQSLEGIAAEEANPAMRALVEAVSGEVRTGASLSGAMASHPGHFPALYTSMIRVGEEAGVLPRVMNDLADLLERDDEVRSEVVSAIAYPLFVLGFGCVTVAVLLTVVLPKLFSMLEDMTHQLPVPTRVLLNISRFLSGSWPWILAAVAVGVLGFRHWVRTPLGAVAWDGFCLRIPFMGALIRSASLNRFARTLGILVKSGVSLLPALKIVESTLGNRIIAAQVAQVAEETRGGDSLATPLRKLGVFPRSAVQMIAAGEESGQLADMLGKVAEVEERHLRAHTKTLVSLLAPVLILGVGAVVGFMVIAILLPIFRLSHGVH